MRCSFRQREEALPQLSNALHFFRNEIAFLEPVVTNDRFRGIIRVPEPVAILERRGIGPIAWPRMRLPEIAEKRGIEPRGEPRARCIAGIAGLVDEMAIEPRQHDKK